MRLLHAAVAALVASGAVVEAVDRSKFRTCQDASFCRRHRSKTAEPELRVDPASLKLDGQVLKGTMHTSTPGAPPLALTVAFYESGIARIRILEDDGRPARWESPDIVLPSGTTPNTAAKVVAATDGEVARVLAGSPLAAAGFPGSTLVTYTTGSGALALLVVKHHPFSVELYLEGASAGGPAIVVNSRGLSHFEHRREKAGSSAGGGAGGEGGAAGGAPAARKVVTWGEDGKPVYEDGTTGEADGFHEDEDGGVDHAAHGGGAAAAGDEAGLWEENFQTHRDSKPHGPMSVGVDVVFPSSAAVYGIPEHASSHALRATDGSEGPAGEYTQPYRLYNLDVFEYELDNPMALYGSIPFMLAHSPDAAAGGATVGVYWNNPTETYVDVTKGLTAPGPTKRGVGTRWISESGIWDLSLIPGPAPKAVVQAFTSLVGRQELPPLFALGYHQCRWNYKDEADVFAVDAKFEEHAFPYDVLWLDIEHTDGKRYFSWDANLFPNPAAMQDKLAARGHKMVTIIDPHIKRDGAWRIHSEATSKGLYIKDRDGNDFEGWCWPGSSSYLDFTSPNVRSWWADQFSLDKYTGSTLNLYTWNDMNEPSVFNGPEVSMHKDAKSLEGVEHREWHNLYGFYQLMATHEGQLKRQGANPNTRPFALSRAFFAGTQRYGAIWTGDNFAKWDHLAASSPMLLTIGVSGLTFAGADVGGFFQNPSSELLIRWYQAGAFQPFFRAHAHIDTARREPWLFGDEVLTTLRSIVRTRYTYLPLWYTLFHAAATTGVPAMRPLWFEYPADPAVTTMEDQWLVGSDLLVKPVSTAGATSLELYFPGGADGVWYDTVTFARYGGGAVRSVAAPLNTLPVFQRGGAIVPRQMRPRRSSALMAADPYTLIVTLSAAGSASGSLYLDDGSSYDYARRGAFRLKSFEYTTSNAGSAILRSTQLAGGKAWAPENGIERIVVAGAGKAPVAVTAMDHNGVKTAVAFSYDAATDALTLKKPEVKVAYDWTIALSF